MMTRDTLTARAVLWGWAAGAFAYPDQPLLDRLCDAGERGRLLADAIATGDSEITSALQDVWTVLDTASIGDLSPAEEHSFLFGRHVRVPPYESSYVLERGADRSTHLTEIGGLYAAFGLSVSAVHPEMPDHLGAECELLAVLLAKEAYARAMGWSGRAKLTRRARRKLVQEHLRCWLPAFAERLVQHRRLPLYPALTRALLALLNYEEQLFGLPLTQSPAPLTASITAPVPETTPAPTSGACKDLAGSASS